jgi:hypothetical protein
VPESVFWPDFSKYSDFTIKNRTPQGLLHLKRKLALVESAMEPSGEFIALSSNNLKRKML